MKLKLLSLIAKLLGIQFKVEGIPYGGFPHHSRVPLTSLPCRTSLRPSVSSYDSIAQAIAPLSATSPSRLSGKGRGSEGAHSSTV
jgi:hypothetical protein